MRSRWRKLLAEGISQKISPPLVSKPQIPALARGLCWMCKKRSGVADEKKGKKTVGCHTNEMQILCVWFLCHELKQKKGKRWNMERNKHHRGWPGLLFHLANWGSAPLQPSHYPGIQSKGKENQAFPSSLQSLSLTLSVLYFSSLFLFLIVSLWFVPSTVCSPEGIVKTAPIHSQAPKRPHDAAYGVYFSLFEVRIKSTVAASLDWERFSSAPLWKSSR